MNLYEAGWINWTSVEARERHTTYETKNKIGSLGPATISFHTRQNGVAGGRRESRPD